jgi:hypothetical protein
MTIPILLADVNVANPIPESASQSGVSGTLIVLNVLLMVAVWFVASEVVPRVQRYRRHLRHHRSKTALTTGTDTAYYRDYTTGWRHRSRRHSPVFPLNPTLAEVGGLPPIRANHQSPSAA